LVLGERSHEACVSGFTPRLYCYARP